MNSQMDSNGVSVILLNYKRSHNMARIIASIKAQTVPTEIILVDNGPNIEADAQYAYDGSRYHGVDLLVQPTRNLGCYIRLLMAHYASHRYVLLMDDDLVITDSQLLEDTIKLYQHKCSPSKGSILGAYGRMVLFHEDKPYSAQNDVIMGYVNAIKGRFMFFEKSVLDRVPIGSGSQPYDPFNEDLYFSLMAGKGNPVHCVSEYISTRLQNLDMASGLCDAPDHMDKRDAMCKWWKERADVEFIRGIF